MTDQNIEVPFPQVDREQADKSIRQQFEELQAREQAQREQAQNAELQRIKDHDDAAALRRDMRLRIKFVERFGVSAFSDLCSRALGAERKAKDAEREERLSRSNLSTTQGRISEINKQRKAAN